MESFHLDAECFLVHIFLWTCDFESRSLCNCLATDYKKVAVEYCIFKQGNNNSLGNTVGFGILSRTDKMEYAPWCGNRNFGCNCGGES